METSSLARERMLAGLPALTRTLDVAGVATKVWEAGDGPAVLLLHGGIECGGAMWAPAARRLAERHRVVVPDIPGLGESAPVPRLDVHAFTRWAVDLRHQLDVRAPVVVAHSLIGSLTAAAAPRIDAIRQLVIYAAPGIAPYRIPARLRYLALRFAIRPTARNGDQFDRFALHDLDYTRRRDPGWFEAFQSYTRSRAAVPHVKRTMRQLIASGTVRIPDADLGRIAIPTTLLWGRHDRMVPLAVAHQAAARHGWPLHVIEDAGHVPHIEEPDMFCAQLESIIGRAE